MASLKAHLFDAIVRYNVRTRLGPSPDIATIRASFNRKNFPDPPGVAYVPGEVGGIPGEWVRANAEGPPSGDAPPRLLYLHGGGFIGCSPRTHRAITGTFARAGFAVFVPDYRLAPEHPFPAGLDDAVAAWRAFAADGPAVIAGDSAGGNLALGVMGEARRLGLPMPAAAALFSPSTDLLGRGASFLGNRRWDAMFRPESLGRLVPAYMGGADPLDPRASPIEADLAGLPPLLIHVGAREILRDDSVRLARKAETAGVRVALTVWPVVPHVWQLAQTVLPEARRSMAEASAFLKAELAGAPGTDTAKGAGKAPVGATRETAA